MHAESSRKFHKVYEPDPALLVHHELKQIQSHVLIHFMNCSITFTLDIQMGKEALVPDRREKGITSTNNLLFSGLVVVSSTGKIKVSK